MTPFYALVPFLGALGLFLFAGGLGLTVVGEQMALNSWNDLNQIRAAAVSVDPDRPSAGGHGKLVHLIGRPEPDVALVPPDLELVAEGVLRVRQTVRMYQWVEETTGLGPPRYERRWVQDRIDSDAFQDSQNHRNPPLPWRSGAVTVPAARIGRYTVPGTAIDEMSWFEPLKVCSEVRAPGAAFTCEDGDFYLGRGTPAAPEVGDVRLALEVVPAETVTVLARQIGTGQQADLVPWRLSEDRRIFRIRRGAHDLETMLAIMQTEDAVGEVAVGGLGTLATGAGAAAVLYTVASLWPTSPGALIWRNGLFTSTIVTSIGASSVPRTVMWLEEAPAYAALTALIGAASIWLILYVL